MENHALLSADEERHLLERAMQGDQRAVDELVRHNQRLVYAIATRYYANGVYCGDQEIDDVAQWGNLGLLHALRKWDSTRGRRFTTYAVHWIRAYVRRYGAIRGSAYGMTYRDALRIGAIRRARSRLLLVLEREPNAAEIAGEANLRKDDVERWLPSLQAQRRLDAPVETGEGEMDLFETIPDHTLESTEEAAERSVMLAKLREMVSALPEREREVVTRRYLINPPDTLAVIAADYGFTTTAIQHIERAGLRRLRRAATDTQMPLNFAV